MPEKNSTAEILRPATRNYFKIVRGATPGYFLKLLHCLFNQGKGFGSFHSIVL